LVASGLKAAPLENASLVGSGSFGSLAPVMIMAWAVSSFWKMSTDHHSSRKL